MLIRGLHTSTLPRIGIQLLGEAVLITGSILAGLRLCFWNDDAAFRFYTLVPDFLIQAAVVAGVFQICFYCNDLYDPTVARRRSELIVRVGESLGLGCIILGGLYCSAPELGVGRGVSAIAVLFAGAAIGATQLGLEFAWNLTGVAERVLVLGNGQLAMEVGRELTRREGLGIRIIGFSTDDPPTREDHGLWGRPLLGSIQHVEEVATKHRASSVIVACEDGRGRLPIRQLLRLKTRGVRVVDAHTVLSRLTGRIVLESVRPSWFVFSDGFAWSRVTRMLKRSIDIIGASCGLLLSAPVLVAVWIAVKLDSPGQGLYRQTRVGRQGETFELLKFRSMRTDAEKPGQAQWAQENDPRVTRVGRLIRKYRFDELPQFINVLRGEMSFVGPRPERPQFVDLLRKEIAFYDERHSVRPGITGWAQVKYRYGASVDDARKKLEYDLFYLKNSSVVLDILIVLQTFRIILSASGSR